jgi:NAD(P)-dependent dehydrogenase (short-subunit alcohol dehydrogenase family)
VAIVLGASAEGGTGWAVAESLSARGAKVLVSARSREPLQRLAKRIGGIAVPCDVTDEAQVAALGAAALREFGALHLAVNLAALPVAGLIDDVERQTVQDALAVNYLGNVFFVKHMARAIGRDGSIVVFSSMGTTHPVLPHFSYCCAKAATDCLVRYAALEYGPRGIRVNSILPGGIVSDLTRDLLADPATLKAFEREVPLSRMGYPADFADAVLWLGNAFVTGLNLNVSGGNQLTRFPRPDELPGGSDSYRTARPLFDRMNDHSSDLKGDDR